MLYVGVENDLLCTIQSEHWKYLSTICVGELPFVDVWVCQAKTSENGNE